MIVLDKHIEILLLSNDCVIVPGLGGFMAHHVEAHYDEHDHIFLPPSRTLGFNPQLKLNDSLLAQSYIEAYDISYPEAIRRIEDEVCELKQHLSNEGFYELYDLGTLSINEEGNYVFEPCEAGILTPDLYGLCSFEMKPLGYVEETAAETALQSAPLTVEDEEESHNTIRIKVAWLRNAVAVAAAIIAFVLIATPVSNSVSPKMNMSGLHDNAISKLIPKEMTKGEVKVSTEQIQRSIAMADSIAAKDKAPETQKGNAIEAADNKKQGAYCIVLASYIPLNNARDYVNKLREQGLDDTYTYERNHIVRVVYGNFKSEAEAYNKLKDVRGNKNFEQSWVLKK